MQTTLHFMCGKMAAGKSTLSKKLAVEYDAILLSEDELLKTLYPKEIQTLQDYVKYSSRLKQTLQTHIITLLEKGNHVVLDFPANTQEQRNYFKELFKKTNSKHCLHYVKRSNAICKEQLKKRNENLPKDAPLIDEATFDAITQYFQEPKKSEGFNIKLH